MATIAVVLPVVRRIERQADVEAIRRIAFEGARSMGASKFTSDEITLIVSELATNLIRHADGGEVHVKGVTHGKRRALRILSVDHGPGIADVEKAMREGFTTSGGLGQGLPIVKRLADEFALSETTGGGTRIEILKWMEPSES